MHVQMHAHVHSYLVLSMYPNSSLPQSENLDPLLERRLICSVLLGKLPSREFSMYILHHRYEIGSDNILYQYIYVYQRFYP